MTSAVNELVAMMSVVKKLGWQCPEKTVATGPAPDEVGKESIRESQAQAMPLVTTSSERDAKYKITCLRGYL